MLLVDMGFNLNLRARVSPRAMIIVNLYLIALFLEATAANGEMRIYLILCSYIVHVKYVKIPWCTILFS